MTGAGVTRSDIDQIEQKLRWFRMQLAGLFKEQQVYIQDIVDIALQYQEHLKQLQAAQCQYETCQNVDPALRARACRSEPPGQTYRRVQDNTFS